MPLARIGATFIYAPDEHNTVTVPKTVQELEAENWMHFTGKYAIFQQTAQPHSPSKNLMQMNWCLFIFPYMKDRKKKKFAQVASGPPGGLAGAKKKHSDNFSGSSQAHANFKFQSIASCWPHI